MFTVLFSGLFVAKFVSGASISASLSSGICLCVNEPNVAAVKDRKSTKFLLLICSSCSLSWFVTILRLREHSAYSIYGTHAHTQTCERACACTLAHAHTLIPTLNYISASNPSSVVTTLGNGVCFQTHGGIYHENSLTYYELVDNGQVGLGVTFMVFFSDWRRGGGQGEGWIDVGMCRTIAR